MALYVCSDLHFNHGNIIKYCNRPYKHVDEMNKSLLDNWNGVVRNEDSVYYLGDFGLGSAEMLYHTFFKNLRGQIHFLRGNHDSEFFNYLTKNIKHPYILPEIFNLSYNKHKFVFSHFPLQSWNGQTKGSIHCFGHIHNKDFPHIKNRYNVCMEAIGYVPISLENIISRSEKDK